MVVTAICFLPVQIENFPYLEFALLMTLVLAYLSLSFWFIYVFVKPVWRVFKRFKD